MPRKQPKTAVVAFKVEKELAEILNQLPNKSAFIRRAIVGHLDMACPMCHGTGAVPRGLHDYYAAHLPRLAAKQCDGCGDDVPLPEETAELRKQDRARLEQFFHGGPLYCDRCFDKAPACDDCGWHIAPDQIRSHLRKAHDD